MAETVTTHYGWTMPDPGASANTWGNTLNATTQKIDAQVFTNAQMGVPVGSGALWFTNTPPTNWLLCQGQSLATTGTYAALFAIIGYAWGGSGANFNLPNFLDIFPIGAQQSYALASRGGASTVTLDSTMIPPHAHSISDPTHAHGVYDPQHTHGVSQSAHAHSITDQVHSHSASETPHNHTVPGSFGYGIGAQAPPNPMVNSGSTTTSTAQPAITVNGSGTGINGTNAANANIGIANAPTGIGIYGAATGITGTNNAGGGAAHNNIPPFLAINFIIKYQ